MTDLHRLPEPGDPPEPLPLRGLRIMVTVLIAVLIVGVITVAVTLVIRLGALESAPKDLGAPIAAEALILPEGENVIALGRGPGEILVFTRGEDGQERLRSFAADTGEERSVTAISRD